MVPRPAGVHRAPGVTFLDRNGVMIAARGPRHGQRVRLAELPAYVPEAFIAIEDRRFRDHIGIDAIGLVRAALEDTK